MASWVGFALRIVGFALSCMCIGGCKGNAGGDDAAEDGDGTVTGAGSGGADSAADGGTVTLGGSANTAGSGGGGAAGSAGSSGDAGRDASGELSFSEQHAAEIQKDCTESVNCAVQRDEQVEENPFEECVANSAAALDGDPQRQATFLANYGRCKSFIVCDYYDCALSGTSGYGESQAPQLRRQCEAESACRAQSGTPDSDPQYAVDSCVAIHIGELDAYTDFERSSWEAAFWRCSTLTSCDFVSCFETP